MNLFGKDLDHDVPLIAEIGVNHEGDPKKALELIGLAARAGADAVKFQTYTPERYASAIDPERLERVTRFSLDPGFYVELAGEAKHCGIHFFSTSVTEDVVGFLSEHCCALKVASGDITFEPVIRASVATGKPVIISTGAATTDEVGTALAWCKDEIGSDDIRDHVVLMHCISAYPTPLHSANLSSIRFLADTFGLRTGYSNHVIEHEAVIAAVALGACVVEVHFTDQKHGRTFRDHELSADPDDMGRIAKLIPAVKSSLGVYGKVVSEQETEIRDIIRKGVVAADNLKAGTVLQASDLMYARPATEIPAGRIGEVIGSHLRTDVAKGHPVRWEHIRRG